MAAQTGNAISLGYGPQGAQQAGGALLLAAIAPPSPVLRTNTGRVPWGTSAALHTPTRAAFVPTAATDKSNTARWPEGIRLERSEASPWGMATRRDDAASAPWGGPMAQMQPEASVPWGLAAAIDDMATAPWGGPMAPLRPETLAPWTLSARVDQSAHAPWGGPMLAMQRESLALWGLAVAVDMQQWIPWTQYSRQLAPGWEVVIPVAPPGESDVLVPVRSVYVIINNIDLRRVEGNISIPAYTFTMSLDADSWTWSWSATLPADARPYVAPATNGDPAELEVAINGLAFRLAAEGIGRDRAFANTRIKVRGRGKAAILDAPYAPVINQGNAVDRTAQQLMGDVLTINGVGIGWAVDWRITDWLVPGNVWAHQGVYIESILDIAGAAGAYVQPHPTAATLIVLPRYPSAPWDWAAISPDFELPPAVVSVEGIDWQRKPGYDRVHVSGTSAGVLGEVTRTSTAGAAVAPMVTHSLITHADAARQRGLAVLSDTGLQARISLKLPVLPETGIITPGKFVRYADGAVTRLGLVRATSIDWARPVLRQTISVETHEA